MVYASEMLGPPPVLVASLTTSIGFASHHSPDHCHDDQYLLNSSRILLKKNLFVYCEFQNWEVRTKKQGRFALWLLERVGISFPWMNNQSSIHSGSKPRTVCMPPKCTFLPLHREPIRVTLPWSDRALCDKFRSISPCSPHLPNPMPGKYNNVQSINQEPKKVHYEKLAFSVLVLTSEWLHYIELY